MQFSTVLLALAASASAAVIPRDGQGQWVVNMSLGPEPQSVYIHAEFTSDEYPEDKKLRSTCVEAPNATLPVAHGCDRAAFDFSFDGKTIKLQQNLPNGITVFGEAPFEGGNKYEGIIPVTSAIA
ncbi:hypothetical protein yc1106_06947 [Curvularia clavata]|uniref:AA1-like domain-containing protein n=1 Tax=Curvularia clavata TaxID=95742 RepID=A0A9Q9DTC2_CURCL|nr:hypothetical protein yc1106_06947 [Curvularia clavata]